MRFLKFLLLFALLAYACGGGDDSVVVNDDIINANDDTDNDDNSDDGGNDNSSNENNPPGVFNLLTIGDAEENIALENVEFNWESAVDPDGDTVTYSLIFDEGDDTPITLIAENLVETTFELTTELPRNTFYSWQVIASDSEGATTNSAIFTFTTKPVTITKLLDDAEFKGRSEHTSVVFDNRIWILGGIDRHERADDIWSSIDGMVWVKETNNAGFISRGDHASVVFNNKMWVIGGVGNSSDELLNDVWSSSDGINWVEENANASFSGRYNHTTVVYDNKIWLIGGQDFTNEFKDIWSSVDGVNWVLVTDNPDFPSRHGHTSLVFNNRIFVIGGINSNQGGGFGALNDVWSSTDGVNWKLETIDADFPPRWGHSSVFFKEEIWVFGGLGAGRRNDTWSSKDGVNWRIESSQIPYSLGFSSRFAHTTTVFNNRILLIGGNDGSTRNDVFSFE